MQYIMIQYTGSVCITNATCWTLLSSRGTLAAEHRMTTRFQTNVHNSIAQDTFMLLGRLAQVGFVDQNCDRLGGVVIPLEGRGEGVVGGGAASG